ncbi:hypothetical protein LWI29_001876 [Acer saccharum]|uniref:Uncharacterized protein n=1 Tax=Acer saccharum TaxID=4024 RepID=A0AA39VNR8_ACESA|nr:hypothetical protein LWI29_001876 [Acer saccharum]
MSCVSSVQFKVLVNGEASDSFRPKCGIRQGDPLSPYLFVLCMEKLSHIIQLKITEGLWKPVKISRGGPAISHLFFADDLILFGQASVKQAQVMKDCIDLFCDVSGQQVSFPKSRVLCSNNVSNGFAKTLAEICGSPVTKDLGKYLGVPLIHGRITKDTYKDILDRIQSRLSMWKSSTLSFAGRCTLIKAVSSAIPIYAMQSSKLPNEMCLKIDMLNRNFLWGHSAEDKKIHLIKWDTVCYPKHQGGLGIKKSKKMNQALLAKAGWRLMQNKEGLWGNLLKHKYLRGDSWLELDKHKDNASSSIWRSIKFGSKVLLGGLKWRVGNGDRIAFWCDVWVPDFGKLQDHAIIPLSSYHFSEKVSDYLYEEEWNVQKLCVVLPWQIIHRILSTHAGSSHSGEDRVIWGLSNNGQFSVKSAYESIVANEEVSIWKWDFLWKLKLPPRVQFFLWAVLHGKILTNEHRVSRGLTMDMTCSICNEGCENLVHVFKGCSAAVTIWEDICMGVTSTEAFNLDWSDWLHQNLKCSSKIMGSVPSYLLFAITLWFLWKWRCKAVFEPSFKYPGGAGKIISNYVEGWFKANGAAADKRDMRTCFIAWSPPDLDWVKLNVDGSLNPESGMISAGGIVRNHLKNWIGGFALNRGTGSILEAELWGIFEGLQFLWKAGFKKVVVESDSQIAVGLLTNSTHACHPLFSIIQSCKGLMSNKWCCIIRHVYREGNRVADGIAKLGHSLGLGITFFSDPPPQIFDYLEDDYTGLATARLVSSS